MISVINKTDFCQIHTIGNDTAKFFNPLTAESVKWTCLALKLEGSIVIFNGIV